MLVHGDEGAQGERGDLLHNDGRGRAVALEDLVGQDGCSLLRWHVLEVLEDFFSAFAFHESLRLGQEVGQEDLVVETVLDWVEGLGWGNEVTRDQPVNMEKIRISRTSVTFKYHNGLLIIPKKTWHGLMSE